MKIQSNQDLSGHRQIDYDFFTNQAHTLRSATLREWFTGTAKENQERHCLRKANKA